MMPVGTSPPATRPSAATKAARSQIRGSSLLLSGRLLSVGMKFATQILMVRYLSTSDYGAWAYALAAVAFLGSFAHLGLDRGVTRFGAIYHQQKQYGRFFGTLLLVTTAILATSALFIGTLFVAPGLFAGLTGGEEKPLLLLFIVIFLVPLETLDALIISVFATLNRARAILIRRYVVTPVIQLSVVLILILREADVFFLAWGYLAGTIVGVAISASLLSSILRQDGLISEFGIRRIDVPAKALFAFTLPLMTSDWLSALIHSFGTLMLGFSHDTSEIALLRVVLPLAVMTQVVMHSFHTMYMPTASRLFADDDRESINSLYWQTSLWIAVLSFPVFAVIFAAATPLTVTLFGARYADAGPILAVLVLGQYLHVCLGFNGSTLKVLGKVYHMVVINVTAAAITVALTLLLVPPLGAMGAAVAMSASMVAHNVLKQIALHMVTGHSLVDAGYVRPFAIIASAVVGLGLIRLASPDHPVAMLVAPAVACVLVLATTRKDLRIGDVFPEAARLPLIGRVLT
jgi:O-antigen/teichoic acid export membrane protein